MASTENQKITEVEVREAAKVIRNYCKQMSDSCESCPFESNSGCKLSDGVDLPMNWGIQVGDDEKR